MNGYIEFSFYLPFFDLIDDTAETSSLDELMRQFNLSLNIEGLYNQYLSYGDGPSRAGKGDVFVFLRKMIRKTLYSLICLTILLISITWSN